MAATPFKVKYLLWGFVLLLLVLNIVLEKKTIFAPTMEQILVLERDQETVISIPPSKMKFHYHEMWNHTTSTIEIPDEYQNPFDIFVLDGNNGNRRRPLTSLEILQNVLHGTQYRAEFEAVEAYMDETSDNANSPIPKCLLPDVKATQKLANRIVQGRNERQRQRQPYQQRRRKKKRDWQYDQLMLPLPILNGEDTIVIIFESRLGSSIAFLLNEPN